MTEVLKELSSFAEAARPAEGPGRLLVQVITPGWGSSGYYGKDVLEAAGRDKVWPKGTHMYVDHPSESESFDRPERTIKDLAAVTTEDARWDPETGALVAEARVFTQWRQPLADMAEAIGVSIRGAAEGQMGEAEGRKGMVFSKLVHGESIDFVTHAGRGGKVLEVLESQRTTAQEARNVGQWVESRIHRDFTVLADEMFGDGRLTREERISLSGGIGDALAAFVARIEAEAPGLYARDIWDDAPAIAPAAAVEAEHVAAAHREHVHVAHEGGQISPVAESATPTPPVSPAGSTPTQEKNMSSTQIEESRLRSLEEAAGRVPTLENERDTAVAENTTLKTELAVERARNYAADFARKRVTEANRELPARVVDRIVAEATREIPLTDELRLDTDKVGAAADAARATEEAYLASIAEESGIGSVRGVGPSGGPTQLSEADLDAARARAFGRTPTVKGA